MMIEPFFGKKLHIIYIDGQEEKMADCIFCMIVQGKIPCARLMEDDHVISFLDINPINPGHALVVPKKHYPTLFEIPAEELEACILASQKIGKAVFKAVGASGLNLVQNNFRSAGQLIDHVHFHLIPRDERDGFLTAWPGRPYAGGEIEKMLEKVKAHM